MHKVDIDIDAHKNSKGIWNAKVKITDKFDFTEWVNPLNKGSAKNTFLWLANDFAYLDASAGFLDLVEVEITYSKNY